MVQSCRPVFFRLTHDMTTYLGDGSGMRVKYGQHFLSSLLKATTNRFITRIKAILQVNLVWVIDRLRIQKHVFTVSLLPVSQWRYF